MPDKPARRIHGTKTLYDLLPKGAEGGKEFARLVNLLLFHQGRKHGKNVQIFDDAAGDYNGLDAFEKSGRDTIGYQHKFYPSPLTPKTRSEIKESIELVARKTKTRKVRLRKLILVTPRDLLESATRKGGGDVTWFESLSSELALDFELEHWGHTALQELLLDTPSIGVFYYPELFRDGTARRKTIQDLTARYLKGLDALYRRIEFVGMSVHKQEAGGGVPMEHIYIPLSAIPNTANENDPNVRRINPLDFLERGTRHVLLGDPGSGKTTALRFLSLVGRVPALQRKYDAKPDERRLPFLVTLRRYADELKREDSLSLVDYLRKNIEADFSLPGVTPEFLEYYLESGLAILLFDGLDELPSPAFKKKIRDRILTLNATYPGNTMLVSSRIVGYDASFGFDDKEFTHHRLARLSLPEIEQFVRNWYAVRFEETKERTDNINSLLGILRAEQHKPIRDLAENPLLLTIIVLVHRIDGVLPDARVVLYERCTETLLNTWHTWRFHDPDSLHKTQVDRQNRQRMEAVAHWMHCQAGGQAERQQAVVAYEDIHAFLTAHIANETPKDPLYAPTDIATDFLKFVQDRAGLLVEVGDRRFSFVHLTFQEYLAAAHIAVLNEVRGAEGTWNDVRSHCGEPRWHEVLRLFVAKCGSDAAQAFFIDKMLEQDEREHDAAFLLGGLLLDGIGPAQALREEIFRRLLVAAACETDETALRTMLDMLRACDARSDDCREALQIVFRGLLALSDKGMPHTPLMLIGLALGWPGDFVWRGMGKGARDRDMILMDLLMGQPARQEHLHLAARDINEIEALLDLLIMTSWTGSFLAVTGEAVAFGLGTGTAAQWAFEHSLVAMSDLVVLGPVPERLSCGLLFSHNTQLTSLALDLDRALALDQARARTLDRALEQALGHARNRVLTRSRALARSRVRDRVLAGDRVVALDRALAMALARAWRRAGGKATTQGVWECILAEPELANGIADTVWAGLALHSEIHWREALRARFLPHVPERITSYDERTWQATLEAFETGATDKVVVHAAGHQLILDGWMYIRECYNTAGESPFRRLAEVTRDSSAAPLRIAHCIRDLAYGDESRTQDLADMVRSEDPAYRDIFVRCYWRE